MATPHQLSQHCFASHAELSIMSSNKIQGWCLFAPHVTVHSIPCLLLSFFFNIVSTSYKFSSIIILPGYTVSHASVSGCPRHVQRHQCPDVSFSCHDARSTFFESAYVRRTYVLLCESASVPCLVTAVSAAQSHQKAKHVAVGDLASLVAVGDSFKPSTLATTVIKY